MSSLFSVDKMGHEREINFIFEKSIYIVHYLNFQGNINNCQLFLWFCFLKIQTFASFEEFILYESAYCKNSNSRLSRPPICHTVKLNLLDDNKIL